MLLASQRKYILGEHDENVEERRMVGHAYAGQLWLQMTSMLWPVTTAYLVYFPIVIACMHAHRLAHQSEADNHHPIDPGATMIVRHCVGRLPLRLMKFNHTFDRIQHQSADAEPEGAGEKQ